LPHAHGGGEVVDGIHPTEAARDRFGIPHVSDHQLCLRGQPVRSPRTRAVDLRVEVVEHPDPVSAREQRVHQMASDEPGAAGHQYVPV
jgi:type 1 glutamine amidotransferase